MHFATPGPKLNRVMPPNAPMVNPPAPFMKPPIPTSQSLGCVGCNKQSMQGVSFGDDARLVTPWYKTTIFKIFVGITLFGAVGAGIYFATRR